MAKLRTNAVLVSVQENAYEGKTYCKANLLFPDDNAVLPIGCGQNTDLVAKLKKLPQFAAGIATVAMRSIKGNTYIDLTDFELVPATK